MVFLKVFLSSKKWQMPKSMKNYLVCKEFNMKLLYKQQLLHGRKFSGLFLNSGDNYRFSDLYSVCLETIDHLISKLWIFSGHIAGILQVLRSEFWKFRILEIMNFHPCCYSSLEYKVLKVSFVINPLSLRDAFCKQSRPRSCSSCKSCLIRVDSVCLWKYVISEPTLVHLTSNFFVLCVQT